jgi:hypothetical protein
VATFVEAISAYIDPDGLIGNRPNPLKWSTGNAIEETAMACAIEVALNGKSGVDKQFLRDRVDAISRCRTGDGGFLSKNPGRPDEITHDDLIPAAALSRICGVGFAKLINDFGDSNEWILSNTGRIYWDARTKPWQRAFYRLADTRKPTWDEGIELGIAYIVDAFSGHPSSNRLSWIQAQAISGMGTWLDSCIAVWSARMRVRYGTVGDMMFEYYQKTDEARAHPYSRYGKLISF